MFFIQSKKKGFSLIELILAVGIFSLSSYVLVTLLVDANLSTRVSTERAEALFYAKEGIELTRLIRNSDWESWSITPDGDYSIDNTGISPVFSTSTEIIDSKYTRSINISTEADEVSRIINSTITWNIRNGREASVSLKTLLTNWTSIVNNIPTSTATSTEEEIPEEPPTDYSCGDPTNALCWSSEPVGDLIWGPVGELVGADSSTNGASNTAILIALGGGYPAAEYCYNLTEGDVPLGTWYLPALNQLSAGFTALGSAFFSSFNYWSSTEFSPGYAMLIETIPDLMEIPHFKDETYTTIRCLR